ncbi:uncharacterized protein LOC129919261 [Episyrphus balteatus]|uniref:uncharacterized protein LOC129919261 n=1 Tax=Episyrphus balteatus TaxID=286459 RepID=UPI0024858696|nr:uncharacterized protein LOC129919261 [Episyrphus balteatus]
MINVVAIFQDFEISSKYFSYSNFGKFEIEEFIWNNTNSVVFPDRMRDLHGLTLPILFGGSESGVIISKNVNGSCTITGGFLKHFFEALAKKHKAKLNISSVSISHSSNHLHHLVLNETIEIGGASMEVIQFPNQWFSYPYMLYDWGVMVPVEPNIPVYKIFAFVFHWEAFLITFLTFILLSIALAIAASYSRPSHLPFFTRDFLDCLRGILGQSFTEVPSSSNTTKIIYSLIFLLGIMMVTSYDAFLQSFMTKPPREKFINSFEDLQLSGLKIFAYKPDIDASMYTIRPKFMKKYLNLFQLESNFETFTKIRNSLNTNYAYTLKQQRVPNDIIVMFLELRIIVFVNSILPDDASCST